MNIRGQKNLNIWIISHFELYLTHLNINQNLTLIHNKMKTTLSFLLMVMFIAFHLTTIAQSSGSPQSENCTQLITVLDDAKNSFEKYMGEETDMDYYLYYYEYDFNLWNDSGRECAMDISGNAYVDFWYNSTYSLEEAKAFHATLLQRMKDCLPSNYFISQTENQFSLVYYKFSDERDRDNTDIPSYPQVTVTVENRDDILLCCHHNKQP